MIRLCLTRPGEVAGDRNQVRRHPLYRFGHRVLEDSAVFVSRIPFAVAQLRIGEVEQDEIPAGIFAKGTEAFVQASGLAPDALASLTWSGFFVSNLIPVTLGNIVGGGLFIALAYWFSFKKA